MFVGLGLCACVQARSDDFLGGERDQAEVQRQGTGPKPAPPPPPPSATSDKIPTRPPPPFDALARARSMPDDLACLKAVSELESQGRVEDGFALLGACAAEGKWRDLRRLLSAPWRARLGQHAEADVMVLLGRVIANRGGLFESDVPLCNLNRVELHTLGEAFQGDGLRPGAWVIVRAFAGPERITKKERRVVLKELTRGSSDRGAEETGATASTKVPLPLPPIEEGQELIVIGRLEGRVGTNQDGYPEARLEAHGVFRPGRTLPDLSP